MAWSDAIYVQFPDEATARVMAASLGVDFPEGGSIPSGNGNYAMQAPMTAPWSSPPVYDGAGEVLSPGVREPGFWAMLRLNTAWVGYAATLAAIEGAGVRRLLDVPPVVWA